MREGDRRGDGAEGNKVEASIWERLDWLTISYKSWLHHKLKNTFYPDGAMAVLYFAVVGEIFRKHIMTEHRIVWRNCWLLWLRLGVQLKAIEELHKC